MVQELGYGGSLFGLDVVEMIPQQAVHAVALLGVVAPEPEIVGWR